MPTLVSRALVRSVPLLDRFAWGSLQAKLLLTADAVARPNGAFLFGYVDGRNFRYVQVLSDGMNGELRIGQVGDPGRLGGAPGVKRRRPLAIRTGVWTHVAVDISSAGKVRVFLNRQATPALTYDFGNAVAGKVGLQASKARSLFDDYTAYRQTSHP